MGLFLGNCAAPLQKTEQTGISNSDSSKDLPSFMIGDFVDDYDIEYRITGKNWDHLAYSNYKIQFWNEAGSYLIAQNDAPDENFDKLWTRIDWIKLDTKPYEWAFCISTHDAESAEDARKVKIANPDTPRTGCNGFPYSRMRRVK